MEGLMGKSVLFCLSWNFLTNCIPKDSARNKYHLVISPLVCQDLAKPVVEAVQGLL